MIGTRLANRYELLEELGSGGMGVVYWARDPWLDRNVAVKLVPPERLDARTEARFQREARLVAQMDHPAIVPIHDFGRHEKSLFFVMPLLAGTTLRQLIEERSLAPEDAVDIAVEAAEALAYSHSLGVIHRDVKPENIMVMRDGGEPRVRVMDFGLAREIGGTSLSRSGGLAGTPAYLSPEQVTGARLDARTDVYSLGAVLYESLAGEPPFDGPIHSVIYRIGHDPPPRLAGRGLEVGDDLERIVLACLSKDPDDRPANARELASVLRSLAKRVLSGDEAAVTDEPPVAPRTRPRTSGSPLPLVGREKEWRRIRERLRAALGGECHLVLLGGEAGVGKSRLLRELGRAARRQHVRVLRGHYSDLEESFHYEGLCDLVQDCFRGRGADLSGSDFSGAESSSSDPAGPGALFPDFTDLAPELLAVFPVLSEIAELRQAARTAADEEDRHPVTVRHDAVERSPAYVSELFARTLIRLADGKPLVLLLENLHEADASIEALKYLVHRLAPTPVMIAATWRPAQADRGHPLQQLIRSLTGHPRVLSLAVDPLSAAELRELAGHVVGSSRLRDNLVARLYETTEGNPLFARELIRSLLETGSLIRDSSGFWSLSGEAALAVHALPATLQQAVERRLERLAQPLREILAAAAVLGKGFEFQELAELTGGGRGAGPPGAGPPGAGQPGSLDLDEAVDQLVEQGILREDRKRRGDRLVFVSGLVRTVLYRDLPRRKRRALHRRYAQQIEKRAAGHPERFYPLLVHHFSAGDVPGKTVEYALAQARWSVAAWSPDDAVHAARIALEFVEEEEVDQPGRVKGELLEILAKAHRARGENLRALAEAERAVAAFRRASAPASAASAAWLATEAAWQARRIDETRRWVDQGIELARGQPACQDVLRRLLLRGSMVANLHGDPELARRYREDAGFLATAAETPPADDVPSGGTLHAALPIAIDRLDPAEIVSDEHSEVVMTVFETLTGLDADGHLTPALCSGWEGSRGGHRFTFALKRGVRFSDGRAVTPAAVKASFERLARHRTDAPPPALAAIAGREAFLRGDSSDIAGIRADDDDHVTFDLAEPLPVFPVLLSDPYTVVVRESEAGSLVGTGAFRLTAHDRERILLERNPEYRAAPPRLEQLEFSTSLAAKDIAEGLRRGEIDLGRDLLLGDLEDLLRDPRFRPGLVEATRKNVHFLLWNLAGPAARSPDLRRALSGVVRPSGLAWRTLGRFAQPAVCLVPPGILGHDPGRRRRTLTRAQASKLLATAGLEAPIRLKAYAHPVLANRGRELLTALFAEWSALGVEVDLQEAPIDTFLEKYQDNQDVDLLIGRWNGDYDDPDTFTYGLFHSRHGLFRRYYCSVAADRYLEEARHETSAAARQTLYQRFEGLLESECAFLPLFHDVAYRVASPRLRGLRLDSSFPYVNYSSVGKNEDDSPSGRWSRLLVERGEIHVPIVSPLDSFDPVGDTFAEHLETVAAVFEGLTRLDENAAIVPWLAASFEAEAEGRRYRVKLRQDVRFHDGRRLCARDVRYSFERALAKPRTGLHFLLLPIRGARDLRDGRTRELAGLQIHSPHELTLELEAPVAFFPALLAHPGAGIVAEGSEAFTGSWRDRCVGTGPFRVLRFEKGTRLELERHPEYWRDALPRCERLTFYCGLKPEQVAAGFREGRYSMASDLPPADVETFRRDPELARGAVETPRLSTLFLVLNSRRGPLADRRRRQALVHGLDVEGLVESARRARGLIPPGLLGYEEPRLRPRSEDSVAALAGLELKVAVIPSYIGAYATLWTGLERSFRRLGIRVEVLETPVSRVVDTAIDGVADVLCLRWLADYPDPDSFVSGLLDSRDGVLSGMLSSPEIDRLCERGRRELDPVLRHAIYRELEEILAREALLVPLVHGQSYRFFHQSVEGGRVRFALPEVRYEELRPRR